jgi:AcrR family transcriptional regulator
MDARYLRTERLLTEALLALIRERPYSALRVEDITERADIARKTFYAHYTHKDELLWHSLETLFQVSAAALPPLDPDTLLMDGKPLSYPVFVHVREYAVFYQDVLTETGNITFVLRLWDYIAAQSYARHAPLREAARHITVPPELTAEMLTGALLGAIRWWLRTNLEATPEQMAYRFSQLLAPGVLGALGLDP